MKYKTLSRQTLRLPQVPLVAADEVEPRSFSVATLSAQAAAGSWPGRVLGAMSAVSGTPEASLPPPAAWSVRQGAIRVVPERANVRHPPATPQWQALAWRANPGSNPVPKLGSSSHAATAPLYSSSEAAAGGSGADLGAGIALPSGSSHVATAALRNSNESVAAASGMESGGSVAAPSDGAADGAAGGPTREGLGQGTGSGAAAKLAPGTPAAWAPGALADPDPQQGPRSGADAPGELAPRTPPLPPPQTLPRGPAEGTLRALWTAHSAACAEEGALPDFPITRLQKSCAVFLLAPVRRSAGGACVEITYAMDRPEFSVR